MKFKLIIEKGCEEEIVAKVHSANDLTRKIEDLVLSYVGEDEMQVQGDYELLTVKFANIECITVIDRKLYVIDSKNNKYRTGGSLSELEERLPSYFIRINKSSLANEHRIARFDAAFSGGVDAVFRCGYREYVSRRCFAEIRKRYEGI